VIYLDTAALVKLVRVEAESPTLIAWLNERASEPLVSSALVEVELPRALRRSQPETLGAVALALSRLNRWKLTRPCRRRPGRTWIQCCAHWLPSTLRQRSF
jgi:predicted nucleic acid-binding protein